MSDQPSRATLLIVDDEPDVLESLEYLFHRRYRVLTAPDGDAALEVLHRDEVDVILSDQRMPGLSGDALLGIARRLFPDTVRIIFTGYADMESVIRAVNEGRIFRYILKPWDVIELESVIAQAVEQRALLAERKRLMAELRAANDGLIAANAGLAEASELKTAFIEVASHEFNTPITLVLGLSELLLLKHPDADPDDRKIVEKIAESARHLARLVADTTKVMRTDSFARRLRTSTVDLGGLLRDTTERIAPFVASRRLILELDVPDDLGPFEIDGPKVGDAVLNLLTNAMKFTPDGGIFGLRARATPESAEVVVYDRGIGLEPRAVRRLFEPFFTEFDPSRHSTGDFGFEKRGLGLGLCIVRGFVEMHGGTIGVESEPGRGTSVTLTLPRRAIPESVV